MTRSWLLRVASHPRHGGGHLARTRVLAAALRDADLEPLFVLDAGASQARATLEQQGFDCRFADQPTHAFAGRAWAGCVLDGYDILRDEAIRWASTAPPMAVLDDFLSPPLGTALVINGAPHLSGSEVDGVPALLGPTFAMIDPRYAALPDRDRSGGGHVLVAFGRLDPGNLATMALTALLSVKGVRVVTVVTSAGSEHLEAVRSALKSFGGAGRLLLDTPDMVAPLQAADFVIGAGGVGLLERMAAGVASLTISIVDNQRLFVEGAVRRGGTVDGGTAASATVDDLGRRIAAVLADGPLRRRVAAAGRVLIDGKGGARVVARLAALSGKMDEKATMGVPNA